MQFVYTEEEVIDRIVGGPGDHVVWENGGLTVNDQAVSWKPLVPERLPPRQLAAADAGRLRPRDVTIFNPSWAGAAGAGISTAEDLAKFAKGICDGSLLNRRWQRTRLDSIRSVEPSNPHSSGYGLAIAKRGAVYGHGGSLPGFQSFIGYDPARKLTLVVWTNLKASPRGLPCAQTIAERLLGRLYA